MSTRDRATKPQPRKLIDLRKVTEPDNNTFICEYCDVKLIPYFDIKHEFVTTGKLYQCGRCGQVKDTAAKYEMKRQEELTTKGDNNNVFVTHLRQPANPRKPKFDIDKGDDEMYRGMGMHIVRTRITVGGKVLRDDREQEKK